MPARSQPASIRLARRTAKSGVGSLPWYYSYAASSSKEVTKMFGSGLMNRDSLYLAALGFLGAVLVSANLFAQTITGTISGTVVDSTGAVAPGAKTTLLDEGTGTTRVSQTNETGIFTFDAVRPGTYTVKVEKEGFRTLERKHLVLAASERLPVGTIE